MRPRHTGLALVYAGPDSDGARIQIPHRRLMQVLKDKPLSDGLGGLATGPTNYLATLYVASLRDIRRTYQRAFKALLFVHRFALAAAERPDAPSELGYLLNHAARFAGTGFARVGPAYVAQLANFDFNYLPVLDDYHAPAGDQRAQPSPPRTWALFDSWERLFDYTVLRTDARGRDRHLLAPIRGGGGQAAGRSRLPAARDRRAARALAARPALLSGAGPAALPSHRRRS